MWFGSYGEGIYSYDGNAFSRFTEKEGLSDDRVRILHYSKRLKSIFAGTYKGLTIIRKNEFKIPSFLKDDFITGIEDAGAFIYVSTNSKHNPVMGLKIWKEKAISQ